MKRIYLASLILATFTTSASFSESSNIEPPSGAFDDPTPFFNQLSNKQSQTTFCRKYYDKNIRAVLTKELSELYKKDVTKPDSAKSASISSLIISTAGVFTKAMNSQGCENDPSGYVINVYDFVSKAQKFLNIKQQK